MIKVYLFDLDDTLINTKIYIELYGPILQLIENRTGLKDAKLDEKAKLLGLTKNKYQRWDTGDLCREFGLLDEYYEILERLISVIPVLHNTVKTVFKKIKTKGRRIGIVSNSMHKTIQTYISKYGLSNYVDFIFSEEDASFRKISDKYWKNLIEKEKLNPADCLVIGDNEKEDVEIPQKFGFRTYHLKDPLELKAVLKL